MKTQRRTMYPLLVTSDWLSERLNEPTILPVFVRGVHGHPDEAAREFLASHIPGSAFLNLDIDLADTSDPKRGRHPLPTPEQFAATLFRSQIGDQSHIIAYDDSNGSQAARLWWMLRWIGDDRVSVLDGGLAKWSYEGRPVESGPPRQRQMRGESLQPNVRREMSVERHTVERARDSGLILLDARSRERFRGENETIDPVAGHIAGAQNAPYADNLEGTPPRFRPASELRQQFERLDLTDGEQIVCYCGSGVTACHNILALELAGIPGAKLYAGSWSEWLHYHPEDALNINPESSRRDSE